MRVDITVRTRDQSKLTRRLRFAPLTLVQLCRCNQKWSCHKLNMACFCVSCYIVPAFKSSVSLVFERMTCMENERIITKYAQIGFWILNQM